MDTTLSATDAIDQSIAYDEIVYTTHSADNHMTLLVACDDHVYANGITEYWGVVEDRSWRVHIHGEYAD
jgi:hypothetical protein